MEWLTNRRNQSLEINADSNQTISFTSPYKQKDNKTSTSSTPSETSQPSIATTQRPFQFLALPAELRNKIYTHLFQSSKPLVKSTYTLPGILHSNHQIHSEALGLYYSTSTFRCLDELSTINWLCGLSKEKLGLLREVRYDTRWIIYKTPFIPVPGAECWLWVELGRKLKEKGMALDGEESAVGKGVMRVSFYVGEEGQVRWTDKMGLIEAVRNGSGGVFLVGVIDVGKVDSILSLSRYCLERI